MNAMARREPLPESLPRAGKARRGAAREGSPPPLAIRGAAGDEVLRRDARERLGRKLGKFSAQIERATVRFEDVNGPKGGVDDVCRIKVVIRGAASIVVEERGASAGEALVRAAAVAERALRRTLERQGRSSPRASRGQRPAASAPAARPGGREADDGSLIGRRVGRSKANLARALARPEKLRRDAFVDTAAPGTSASDRKAGYGATAARNTRAGGSGLTYALEDSRKRPSRKSTRKSSQRARPSAALERNVSLQAQTPKARARRSQARRHP